MILFVAPLSLNFQGYRRDTIIILLFCSLVDLIDSPDLSHLTHFPLSPAPVGGVTSQSLSQIVPQTVPESSEIVSVDPACTTSAFDRYDGVNMLYH